MKVPLLLLVACSSLHPFSLLAKPLAPTVGCDFAPLTNCVVAPRVAVDLAGDWELSTDRQRWKAVRVPGRLGVKEDTDYYLRRTVATPDGWKRGDRALVNFENIGYEYEVFVNGEKAAAHGYSFNIPQRIDVSRLTNPGKNELMVRVWRSGKKRLPNAFRDQPTWKYPEPWCPLGITMPVHMEFSGPVSVEDVTIVTKVTPEKELAVSVCVTNCSEVAFSGTLTGKVNDEVGKRGAGGQWSVASSLSLKSGEGKTIVLKKPWPEAHLWNPDDPYLYNLDLAIHRSPSPSTFTCVDAMRQRFGFREVSVRGHRFYLNGHPFIARASTHLPDQRLPADCYRAFFARCKAAGVNAFRSRYREHTRTLELADECGAFIMPQAFDSANAHAHSDVFWQRFHQELRETVKAYKNHPSVLLWGLSNEFGTFYGGALGKKGPGGEKEGTDRQAAAGAVLSEADPTRVWTACGDVDLCYPARGRNGPAPTRSFHYPAKYCTEGWELPMTNSVYWYLNGRESWQDNSEKDKPLCITEDLYHGVLDQPLGFSKYCGDAQWTVGGWCKTLHWMVHQIAAGYYTSGLGWWDLWTVEKGAEKSHYRDYGQMMPDFLVAMVEPPRNVRTGEKVVRTLCAFNETFSSRDCVLTVNGREWTTLTLPPGGRFERSLIETAPTGLPDGAPWTLDVKLVDRKTRRALTEESFAFRVFMQGKPPCLPKTVAVFARKGSPLHEMAASGCDYGELRKAVAERSHVIVDEALTNGERDLLERFVRRGGHVLYFAGQSDTKGAEPLELQRWAMQTFVWRRDPDAMKDFPEEAFRLWMPDGLVGRSGLPKPEADCDVLWDSGSAFGLEYAQIARIYRGKGDWLVCVPPVMAKYREEPCCPALFRALLREFGKEAKRPKGGVHVVAAAGESTLKEIMSDMGVTIDGGAFEVWWIDASKGLTKNHQNIIVNYIGKTGKLTVVTDLPADADASFLAKFGLKTELPKTNVRTLHPFLPSWIGADSDSDQGVKWVTIDKANPGLLKGVSNEDVFWWNPGNFVGYIPNLITGHPPRGAAWNAKDRNEMIACTSTFVPVPGGRYATTIHTFPAAWAEARVGKARVVLSTLKVANSSEQARKRVRRFLRRVLMNAGVRTSQDPPATFCDVRYVDFRDVANRGYWHDLKYRRADGTYEVVGFTGDETADLRYFPVNLCGWSQISRAPCPRDEFPVRPINVDGESFKLIDPATNGGKGIVGLDCNDTVAVDLGTPLRFEEMHLLLSHAGPGLKVAFGDGEPIPVEKVGPFLYKKGEPCGRIAWQGRTDDGRDTVLYRTAVKNPDPSVPVSRLVFSNPTLGWRKSHPAAILGITIKSRMAAKEDE